MRISCLLGLMALISGCSLFELRPVESQLAQPVGSRLAGCREDTGARSR